MSYPCPAMGCFPISAPIGAYAYAYPTGACPVPSGICYIPGIGHVALPGHVTYRRPPPPPPPPPPVHHYHVPVVVRIPPAVVARPYSHVRYVDRHMVVPIRHDSVAQYVHDVYNYNESLMRYFNSIGDAAASVHLGELHAYAVDSSSDQYTRARNLEASIGDFVELY